METAANTHFPTQYENVHAHSSKQVKEFIGWLSKQAFYKDTTIIILGDHISMQSHTLYENKISPSFTRTTYNTFINSINNTTNTKQRLFTNFDFYPTILSSMGVSIEGDRLGLGVNLFSTIPTLTEKYGIDYLNKELSFNSNFYNSKILGTDFLEMIDSETNYHKN